MRALITGAAGQLGLALMNTVPADVQATALTRSELDIANREAVTRCIDAARPDVIINAAAYTAVDRAESEPAIATAVNETAPRHIAIAAAHRGARLIHVSTDYVFNGESVRPYTPQDKTGPLNVYGRTKLAGEQAVLSTLGSAVILRTSWVYSHAGKNFLLTMLRLMKERGSVRVVADQIGSPTSAASIAEALWRIVRQPSLEGVHHWTDAGVASWYDFAVAIAEEAAVRGLVPNTVEVTPISTSEYPTPAQRPRMSLLDCRSTADALTIARVHWRVWLRRTLDEIVHA